MFSAAFTSRSCTAPQSLRYVMGEISAPATKQLPKAGPDVQSPVDVTIDHPHGGRIKLTYVCWSYKHYRNSHCLLFPAWIASGPR